MFPKDWPLIINTSNEIHQLNVKQWNVKTGGCKCKNVYAVFSHICCCYSVHNMCIHIYEWDVLICYLGKLLPKWIKRVS